MKEFTAIIIDDEYHCIQRLEKLLSDNFSKAKLLGTYQDSSQAKIAVKQLKPDLILLDVELGTKTAFQMLKEIAVMHSEIIFTTGHSRYALKAFEISAVHYLLKPIGKEDFLEAMNRFIDKRKNKLFISNIDMLVNNLKAHSSIDQKMAVHIGTGIVFFRVGEIERLEADGNYCYIFFIDGKKILAPNPLKHYAQLLDETHFFRTHQSHIVHLAFVEKYVRNKESSYVVTQNHTEVPVSVRKREEFVRHLEKNNQM